MGLFDQIASAIGGAQPLQRMENGQANLHDPSSPDSQALNQVVRSAPADVTQEAFAQAAQQVNPQAYQEHITPGAGGTDPLGMLDRGSLGTIAGTLLNSLQRSQGGGAGALGQLQQVIPGLNVNNPQQMSPAVVAELANYMRQNQPEAFGQAASQIGQQQPDLLHSLLGNKALMIGAALLGAKILQSRAQAAQARQRA